jgi:thiamine-monophosphate kinase
MTTHLPLGPGAEIDAIRTLRAAWGPRARGIGDDGAVLDVPAGSKLVVSTDTAVEHVHFRREWLTPDEIGWRATMAALSDLAAMAAIPLGVVLALVVPRAWRADLEGIADGIGAAVGRYGVPIVGGDVTAGERLTLAITVLGHARRPLSRRGARPGDSVYLTGRLGGPGAALREWLAGREPSAEHRLRFARPEARIEAARWCAEQGATAMVDLSDGLLGDLGHLAKASGVRIVVEPEWIPTLSGVSIAEAVKSGEEYEVLCTGVGLPEGLMPSIPCELPLTRIGRVLEDAEVPADGSAVITGDEQGGAHDHFHANRVL